MVAWPMFPGRDQWSVISKGSRKKSSFFCGQSTKAISPSSLGLVVKRTAKKKKKKVLVSLVDNPLPPPILVDCPLKKKKIAASLISC